MPDKYHSYFALAADEREGVDFQIVLVDRSSRVMLAPHGGGIEPGTSEIARQVAGDDLSLYLFEGLKGTGNTDLHVTSHRFNEPRCESLVENAEVSVAIHGCMNRAEAASEVFVGGSNGELRDALVDVLTLAGFSAEVDSVLTGEHPCNICNRSRQGGAQLEITERTRGEMFASLSREGRKVKRESFWRFCEAVRSVAVAEGPAG